MRKPIYVVGYVCGEWTIIEQLDNPRKVKARCSCGAISELWKSNFSKMKSKRCISCGWKKSAETKTNSFSDDNIKNRVVNIIKNGCKQKWKPMQISDELIWILSQSNCHYCGSEPSNTYKRRYDVIKYNGIDRIDSTVGYCEENVRACCWKCNSAKKDMNEKDFREWVHKIYENWQD